MRDDDFDTARGIFGWAMALIVAWAIFAGMMTWHFG